MSAPSSPEPATSRKRKDVPKKPSKSKKPKAVEDDDNDDAASHHSVESKAKKAKKSTPKATPIHHEEDAVMEHPQEEDQGGEEKKHPDEDEMEETFPLRRQPSVAASTALTVKGSGTLDVSQLTKAQRDSMLAQLISASAPTTTTNNDEEVQLEKMSTQPTTKQFLNSFMTQVNQYQQMLMRGLEVTTVTNPDMALLLSSRHTQGNLYWLEFKNIADTVIAWKKQGGEYITIEPLKAGQHFDPTKPFTFPVKMAVLGPYMVAQTFNCMGLEGDYHKLGTNFGPATVKDLKRTCSLTNEVYSSAVCDDNNTNPLANAFFDWMTALQDFTIRKIFAAKGGYAKFKDTIHADLAKENDPKIKAYKEKVDKAKKAGKDASDIPEPDLAKAPTTEEEWLELLLTCHVSHVVKTDQRGVRSISVSASCFTTLQKDKDTKRPIGEDAHHTPRDSPNGIFHKMFAMGVENNKDQQRKEAFIPYWRPLRPTEIAQGGAAASPFPYVRMPKDFVPTNNSVLAPIIKIDSYEFSARKETGFKRDILGFVYAGEKGQLYDNPPTPVNPLLCAPMVTDAPGSFFQNAAAAAGFDASDFASS